jgi:hypothetical protein
VEKKSVVVDGQRRETVDYSQSGRAAERFFAVKFASFILAKRAIILAVFGLLFVGSILEWVLVLRADTESTKFFPERHGDAVEHQQGRFQRPFQSLGREGSARENHVDSRQYWRKMLLLTR